MSRRAKLEALLERDPHDAFVHFALGMELVKEGRVEEALLRFDRAAEIDANYTAAYYHKGNTLLTTGRHAEARAALLAGIEAAKAGGDGHALKEMRELLERIP